MARKKRLRKKAVKPAALTRQERKTLSRILAKARAAKAFKKSQEATAGTGS